MRHLVSLLDVGTHHSLPGSPATCCPVSELMGPGGKHPMTAAWLLSLWHLHPIRPLPWTPFCGQFTQPQVDHLLILLLPFSAVADEPGLQISFLIQLP